MKIIGKKYITFLVGAIVFCSFSTNAQDGEAVFKANCSACHKLGMRLVGPDLLGVNERRNEDWLLSFIKSSQAFIKSGDKEAVALFEEYNQIVMTDQAHLSDDDIKAVLAYIKAETPSPEEVATKEESVVEAVEYSEEDVDFGLKLFSGIRKFSNGGAACISCHNATHNSLISGGLLAKDLTNVYARMGDAGIAGILGAPPFPAMAAVYKNNILSKEEITQLTAFLQEVDKVSDEQKVVSGGQMFLFGGGGGLIVLFLIIGLLWNKRLKNSVKYDIYKRQIKGSDSII